MYLIFHKPGLNHPRIVNQCPEIAARHFFDLIDRILDCGFVGDVEPQGLFCASLCRPFRAFGGVRAGNHIRAFCGKLFHHAQANPRVTAGDDHPATLHLQPSAFPDRANTLPNNSRATTTQMMIPVS